MTKWISQLARKLGFRGTDLGPPCIVFVREGDVRMSLLEFPLDCGRSGYRVDLEYLIKADEWIDVASLRDDNLDVVIDLLMEARQCIINLQGEE